MTTAPVGVALFDIVNVQNWTRRRTWRTHKVASTRGAAPRSICKAGLAHRVEHSPCKREAVVRVPPASTTANGRNRPVAGHRFGKAETGVRSAVAAPSMNTWHALVAKRQTQPPQKRPPSRHGGSSPPGCTNDCSLRQAAKASVLHTDIPRFESWSEHQRLR